MVMHRERTGDGRGKGRIKEAIWQVRLSKEAAESSRHSDEDYDTDDSTRWWAAWCVNGIGAEEMNGGEFWLALWLLRL